MSMFNNHLVKKRGEPQPGPKDTQIIGGDLYVDGRIYLSEDKTETTVKYDVTIEVADNGYLAKVGNKTYVFSNLGQFNEWLIDTFKDIEKAKKYIRGNDGKHRDKKEYFDIYKKLADAGVPYAKKNSPPTISNPWLQWTGGTGITTTDAVGDITYGGNSVTTPYKKVSYKIDKENKSEK